MKRREQNSLCILTHSNGFILDPLYAFRVCNVLNYSQKPRCLAEKDHCKEMDVAKYMLLSGIPSVTLMESPWYPVSVENLGPW